MTHLVFVYGSLKRGFHNAPLLEEAEFMGTALTVSPYMMLDAGAFPLLLDPSEFAHMRNYADFFGRARGEIYKVDETMLARLDHLEGHPHFYRRSRIDVRLADEQAQLHKTLAVWAYLFVGDMQHEMLVVMPDEAATVEWRMERGIPEMDDIEEDAK